MQTTNTLYADHILDKIQHIVADIPGCFLTYAQIRPEHHLREDLGLDSLALVDLMVAVEDTLDVYFDPVQMDLDMAFETVRSFASLVTELKTG